MEPPEAWHAVWSQQSCYLKSPLLGPGTFGNPAWTWNLLHAEAMWSFSKFVSHVQRLTRALVNLIFVCLPSKKREEIIYVAGCSSKLVGRVVSGWRRNLLVCFLQQSNAVRCSQTCLCIRTQLPARWCLSLEFATHFRYTKSAYKETGMLCKRFVQNHLQVNAWQSSENGGFWGGQGSVYLTNEVCMKCLKLE